MSMDNAALRRKELLRQSRRQGNEMFPAIHPRYGNIYRNLYGEETPEKSSSGSFYLRFAVAVLCFLCYMGIDAGKIPAAKVSSERIVSQIEKQTDLDKVADVWKELY